MGTRLYVGNLSYDTTAADLHQLFSGAGTVERCDLMVDRFSGKSRGFAFVEMATAAEADEAIRRYHHTVLDGRTIVVNEAQLRLERGTPRHREGQFRPARGSRRGIRRAKRDRKASW